MKLTKSQLKQIIKEELKTVLNEASAEYHVGFDALTNLYTSRKGTTEIEVNVPDTYPQKTQTMTLTVSKGNGEKTARAGATGVRLEPGVPTTVPQYSGLVFTLS